MVQIIVDGQCKRNIFICIHQIINRVSGAGLSEAQLNKYGEPRYGCWIVQCGPIDRDALTKLLTWLIAPRRGV